MGRVPIMIAIGQLLSTYSLRVVASVIEGDTYVPASMLLEDEEFIKLAQRADSFNELRDYVNENY